VIAYCSGECQRGHWKLHKTVCKETTKRLQTVTELKQLMEATHGSNS
jgi:hypothetical protein